MLRQDEAFADQFLTSNKAVFGSLIGFENSGVHA